VSPDLLAHGIGGVRDLPVPAWLFFWGASVVLVLSFVALGTLWRRPTLERLAEGRRLRALDPLVRSTALRVVLGALSVGLLVLVFLTSLVGTTDAYRNFAPTFVYVDFWLGMVALVVLLGNVWRVLNPWRAVADAVAWVAGRLGLDWRPPGGDPARFGWWPAAVLLLAFATLELAYYDPSNPRVLALAIGIYSYVTWFGAALFGRKWFEHGEAFTVYFGLLSRIAPLAVRDGRVILRPPFTGLAGPEPTRGGLAFVSVMLGTVAFDGISRSRLWQDLDPGTALNVVGVVAACGIVASAYFLAVHGAAVIAGVRRPLEAEFLPSLVPIALVYAVAHYFSLLLVQGQFTWPLLSDPFGKGWDVLGGAAYRPNLNPVSPNTIWYVQVGALVTGHVAGLAVAHDRALAAVGEGREALRSQYPMLALMVLYTVAGLWLLSQG
jgi:hypothetical protein